VHISATACPEELIHLTHTAPLRDTADCYRVRSNSPLKWARQIRSTSYYPTSSSILILLYFLHLCLSSVFPPIRISDHNFVDMYHVPFSLVTIGQGRMLGSFLLHRACKQFILCFYAGGTQFGSRQLVSHFELLTRHSWSYCQLIERWRSVTYADETAALNTLRQ
jgi:hypothetical protein